MNWPTTSPASRGYGATWRRLRELVMRRDAGLCQECKRRGLVGLATEVDHIRPKAKGGDDHVDNLEAICTEHHLEKTAREQGSVRRPAIGLLGWPIE